MKKSRTVFHICTAIVLILLLILGGILLILHAAPWGFAREVSVEEEQLRLDVVNTAQQWLGSSENNNTHLPILEIYNQHQPLARGYAVQSNDDWCSVFVSTVAIQCGLTEYIPTECGCEPQIELFKQIDCWVEDDAYLPLPGDVIFYHWDCDAENDCTHWSDHVGIVTGTIGSYIRVIEGNYHNRVSYRIIKADDPQIRGYGTADYAAASSQY